MTCYKMTVKAMVNKDEVIVSASPITKKFIGQPLENLKTWLKGFKGFEIVEILRGDGEQQQQLVPRRGLFG